jgi:hypothetical protein
VGSPSGSQVKKIAHNVTRPAFVKSKRKIVQTAQPVCFKNTTTLTYSSWKYLLRFN